MNGQLAIRSWQKENKKKRKTEGKRKRERK